MTGYPTPKVPPHSVDAESMVLGALMGDPAKWHAVAGVVNEADFFTHDHRAVFAAIGEQLREGKGVDFVSLADRFRNAGDGSVDIAYLGALQADCPSSANVLVHAKIVREHSQRRRIIAFCQDMSEKAWTGGDSSEIIASIGMSMDGLLRSVSGTAKRFAEAVSDAEATMRANASRLAAGGVVGAPSGLPSLDRVTGGFCGPRLIVVGARPGTGKTALLNQFALHSARHGFPGLICSIEMGADELVIRALASEAQANVTRMFRGHRDEADLAYEAAVRIGDIPLWIDVETTSIEGICAQVSAYRQRHGITWAAVDHVGLIRTEQRFGSRNDQLGHISWTLKALAKRLGIPVIALSQLSRRSENEGRRPAEADLRDSGNVEQDADVILMMHTPPDKRDEVVKPVELGAVKNRCGPKGWIKAGFQFDGRTQTFREISEQFPDAPPHWSDDR